MDPYVPYLITGLAVILTLTFLCRFAWFPRRPVKAGELPAELKIERGASGLIVRYYWGGGWDYLTLLLYAAAIATLIFDAQHSQYPTSLAQIIVFALVGSFLGYGLLIRCVNRTTFTITPEQIAAQSGPLPALEKFTNIPVANLVEVTSRRDAGYGTYTLAVRDKSHSFLIISDSFWSSRVPDAVARLISNALPALRLVIDHDTPAQRYSRRRKV